MRSVGPRETELVKEARDTPVEHTEPFATGLVCERAGEVALAVWTAPPIRVIRSISEKFATLARTITRGHVRAPKWTKAGSFYLPTLQVSREGASVGRTFARDEE